MFRLSRHGGLLLPRLGSLADCGGQRVTDAGAAINLPAKMPGSRVD
jgi:hypothetical protein